MIFTEGYGDTQSADMAMCGQVFEELQKHYPGHPWDVGANHEAGAVAIQLRYNDKLGRPSKYGFLIHINSLLSQDGFKKVVMAGGELLERYNLARKAATEESATLALINGVNTSNEIE